MTNLTGTKKRMILTSNWEEEEEENELKRMNSKQATAAAAARKKNSIIKIGTAKCALVSFFSSLAFMRNFVQHSNRF